MKHTKTGLLVALSLRPVDFKKIWMSHFLTNFYFIFNRNLTSSLSSRLNRLTVIEIINCNYHVFTNLKFIIFTALGVPFVSWPSLTSEKAPRPSNWSEISILFILRKIYFHKRKKSFECFGSKMKDSSGLTLGQLTLSWPLGSRVETLVLQTRIIREKSAGVKIDPIFKDINRKSAITWLANLIAEWPPVDLDRWASQPKEWHNTAPK